MRVNSLNNPPSFKGGLNNKALLFSLEKISEHGASFAAGVSFVSAAFLRPVAISLAPDVEKENKQYFSINSFSSALMKLLVTEIVTLPIENAIKKIDKNPDKFLKKETIKSLSDSAKNICESKNYKFLTQFIKMGSSFLSAIPKSVLTVAMIPVLMDKIFNVRKEDKKPSIVLQKYPPVFDKIYDKTPFKGLASDKCAKGIAKIINTKGAVDFAKEFAKNDTNIARNTAIATDVLLSATSLIMTKKSDKIKEERKKPLMLNTLFSTGSSILFGGLIDKAVQKSTKGFIDKFIEANKNNPKLNKYIEGINILRPTLIFAVIYYGILPVISSYFSDKLGSEK